MTTDKLRRMQSVPEATTAKVDAALEPAGNKSHSSKALTDGEFDCREHQTSRGACAAAAAAADDEHEDTSGTTRETTGKNDLAQERDVRVSDHRSLQATGDKAVSG